jgi:hypothetical protein
MNLQSLEVWNDFLPHNDYKNKRKQNNSEVVCLELSDRVGGLVADS